MLSRSQEAVRSETRRSRGSSAIAGLLGAKFDLRNLGPCRPALKHRLKVAAVHASDSDGAELGLGIRRRFVRFAIDQFRPSVSFDPGADTLRGQSSSGASKCISGTISAATALSCNPANVVRHAKPVPVNFRALRSPRRDMVPVAAAGPVMNIALALVAAGSTWPSRRGVRQRSSGDSSNDFFSRLATRDRSRLDRFSR